MHPRSTPLAVLGLLLLGACTPAAKSAGPTRADRVTSNVLSSDYVGSKACADCHRAEYDAFLDSPMHRMTRAVSTSELRAPFAGEQFNLRGDMARMQRIDGQPTLELSTRNGERKLYRVTKVIGGRYREDFVGVEQGKTEAGQRVEEQILPVSYLIFDHSYRYKGYSVQVTERDRLEAGQTWRTSCIFCHNTQAQLFGLFDELAGPPFPSYQGSASEELPSERRFRYEVLDRGGLDRAVRDELARIGEQPSDDSGKPLLDEAMLRTRRSFDERHLVELGIGCEACHGGAREHVAAPRTKKPSLSPESPLFQVTTQSGEPLSPALEVNRACAKCHTVLFSRYPYTWEGGQRRHDPGGSTINSGEARDFLLGGCENQLSCVACHNPHREDKKADLEALAGPRGDALCSSCHATLKSPEQLRAHTHHAPESSGSRCINCHMPQKNMGLAYELTRYHRIGSPTDRARVEHDRPLECALCHADKSVDQMVTTMQRWWGKSYDRGALTRLYGADLRINPLRATLMAGLPHERATAAALAAKHGRRELLPLVAETMTNDYPLVRYFARRAAERLSGRTIEVDLSLPAADIPRYLPDFSETSAKAH
ncbi:MAG: cytochrome c3 family protein [Polyangiaceae bacterium]